MTTFITNDITIKDFEFNNPDRYDLTFVHDLDGFKDYLIKQNISVLEDYDSLSFDMVYKHYASVYDNFINNYSNDPFEVPMMNALYYYPSYISFKDQDRYKVSSAITLLYDKQEESWAVGMTGGGMDLAPHLLDTFISLGKGVPSSIADAISKNYSAYVDPEKHLQNCNEIAHAYETTSEIYLKRAVELKSH